MDELNPTAREQEIYEEMELTPEMIRSIRTLCVLAPKWVKKMSPRWNFQFCCKIVPPCCYVQSPLPDVPQRASFTVWWYGWVSDA